ncbi:acyltransferase [Bacillus sp. FJAT-51639]|uniref:Acyltransferase n=1 Tax=Bacillus bruguierae TaxID=3127667 RepID=A0ABU8FJV9_9BACI
MQQKKRLNLVQASRAIVPLLVLMFHMSFVADEHFNYNFLNLTKLERVGGADYFFVLTGFMIFYVYFKDIGNKEKFRPFLIKRFIGIYPFYWIVTFIVCVFFFFIPIGYGYSQSIKTILGSLSLFPWQEEPIIYSAWSLRHNILFYLIFSCLILSKGKMFKYLIGLWIMLILFIYWKDIEVSNYLISFMFDKINLNFILGCCCAYISMNFPIKHGKLFVTLGILGYIFTWITVLYDLMKLDTNIMYAISAMFLILGLVSFDMNKKIRIPKIFNYLGNASFSIYLTHPPFLGLIAIIINKSGIHDLIGNLLSTLLCIVIAMIMGCLAHSFIEKPLLVRMKSVFLKPIKRQTSLSATI